MHAIRANENEIVRLSNVFLHLKINYCILYQRYTVTIFKHIVISNNQFNFKITCINNYIFQAAALANLHAT